MYSSLESQGVRGDILWGVWTIRPDGTDWNPLVSAFDPGGAPNGFHFQTQLSSGDIVFEQYYNQNNSGFGTLIKMPPHPRDPSAAEIAPPTAEKGYGDTPAFGPAHMSDAASKPWRQGRFDNGLPHWYRMPFLPRGSAPLTPFALGGEGPADHSIIKDKDSPRV